VPEEPINVQIFHAPSSVPAEFSRLNISNGSPVEEIIAQCLQTGTNYVDPDFAHSNTRLKGVTTVDLDPEWKRVVDLFESPQTVVNRIEPGDVLQGFLADCWFCHLISGIAKRSDLIENIIYPSFSPYGVYSVRIWDEGEWKYIIVDDYFPVYNDRPAFLHSRSPNETWPMILEKAMAKYCGGYDIMDASNPDCPGSSKAFSLLTGGDGIWFTLSKHSPFETWEKLVEFLQQNWIVGASSKKQDSHHGIVSKHAYAILGAAIVNQEKILRLRNPWGDAEWMGRWGEACAQWTPDLRSRLFHESIGDGSFYMSFEDFLNEFSSLTFCRLLEPKFFSHHYTLESGWVEGKVGPWKDAQNPQFFTNALLHSVKLRIVLTLLEEPPTPLGIAFFVHKVVGPIPERLTQLKEEKFTQSKHQRTKVMVHEFDIEPSSTHVYIITPFNRNQLLIPFRLTIHAAENVKIEEM
jgi:hypothetical protein